MGSEICVPDLCTYFDPPEPFLCSKVKNTVIDGNTFYLLSDVIYQETRNILQGTPDMISDAVNDWYIGNIVAYYLPFVIIILLILIVLTINKTLSLTVGILLIVVFLVTVFISVIYIFINTTNLTTNLPQQLSEYTQNRYEENLPDIKLAILKIINAPESIICPIDPVPVPSDVYTLQGGALKIVTVPNPPGDAVDDDGEN
jgi:hypothetical protein